MHPHVPGRRALARRTLGLGLATLVAALGSARTAAACDICAVYTATELGESRIGPRAGVAVQYSHFGTLQDGGEEVPNPEGESIDSVITQIVLGYQVAPRVGVQLNLPLISRSFDRVEDGRRVRGVVDGPGDLSLVGHVLAHSVVTESSVFRFSLLGGLKLPTGDSSRLAEELEEPAAHAAARGVRLVPRHDEPGPDGGGGAGEHHASGVHGHDLALGSGSVDGLVGGEIFWSWKRAFVTGRLQYMIRTEGDFDYRYANDLVWDGGPGAYLLLGHAHSLALQASFAGETKGKDTQQGRTLDDTAVTNLFAGPRLLGTWGTSLAAEATVELPVVQNNTALQIVADYRVRAAVVWRF
jgi:hypothetical protein